MMGFRFAPVKEGSIVRTAAGKLGRRTAYRGTGL